MLSLGDTSPRPPSRSRGGVHCGLKRLRQGGDIDPSPGLDEDTERQRKGGNLDGAGLCAVFLEGRKGWNLLKKGTVLIVPSPCMAEGRGQARLVGRLEC